MIGIRSCRSHRNRPSRSCAPTARPSSPGARSVYSDSNYILLGLILEQVTGRHLATEITQRILDPLGLTQTSFPTSPAMPEPYAHGYAADRPGAPVRDVTRSNPDVAWASGAMLSTLEDLHRWVEILVAGSLLTPALQAERLTIEPWSTEPVSMGYGLGIQEIGGLLGHTGASLGMARS